jgi:hypothetical protein
MIYDVIYLTAIKLAPGGSSTVHIYTQAMHRIQTTEHTYQYVKHICIVSVICAPHEIQVV